MSVPNNLQRLCTTIFNRAKARKWFNKKKKKKREKNRKRGCKPGRSLRNYNQTLNSVVLLVNTPVQAECLLCRSVQSVRPVKYTDCISVEEKHPLTAVPDMTLKHLMARLKLWRFRKCRVSLHCHCSHVQPDQERWHFIGSNLGVK